MNRKLVLWIAALVVTAHGLFFWWVGNSSALPKRTHIPAPNFRKKEAEFTDPKSGGKIVVQEFTVSTRLHESAREPVAEKLP